MPSKSPSIRLALAAAFGGGMLLGLLGQPIWRLAVSAASQEVYGALVFECDQAMREHFLAKARAATDANATTLLAEAEVGLLGCHDYDRMRKRLIGLGLTDDDLGAMGLLAIERRATDIRDIVRAHEIRY